MCFQHEADTDIAGYQLPSQCSRYRSVHRWLDCRRDRSLRQCQAPNQTPVQFLLSGGGLPLPLPLPVPSASAAWANNALANAIKTPNCG